MRRPARRADRPVFARWGETHDALDILVHALAFAKREDLEGGFVDTSRDGFALAQDVSAYSLVALTRAALPQLRRGSSIITLTYYGAEKVVANYNVMGVAKAALEASVRYLAADLGPDGIRVNAISAGPVRTLAAAGIGGFKKMYGEFADVAPLRANITPEDVGRTSNSTWRPTCPSAVTGEVDLRRRRVQHPGCADRGLTLRPPALRPGLALERPDDLRGDPAAIEVARLRGRPLVADPGLVDLPRRKPEVVLDGLVVWRRVEVRPSGIRDARGRRHHGPR